MFKWSKLKFTDGPTTPKLGSVSLPDERVLHRQSLTKRPSIAERKPVLGPSYGNTGPDKRSTPPHAGSSRTRCDSRLGGHPSRTRTTSISGGYNTDGISKPAKMYNEDEYRKPVPTPSYPSKGGSYKMEKTVSCVASSGAAVKGGSAPQPPAKVKQIDYSSSPEVEPRSRRTTGHSNLVAHDHHRQRNQSFSSSHRQTYAPVDQTPKYMKAHQKEVPLKTACLLRRWF
ncbi:hypothetical protein BD779DRAFT_737074 [Infundibulicybe gibba]|nr:hypothetical protein BD779DRAFT_737074 [Infundibulicybe gibba]